MAAAFQAVRLGAGVLVVEPSGWIGGQAAAAGVSTMDDLSPIRSGLYRTFVTKVKKYYDQRGKSIGTCYWNSRTVAFEPSVGQRILYEMASEAENAGKKPCVILTRTSVTQVEREGNTVRGVMIRDDNGVEREIKCRVLIDATEYGDVLPLAGAAYRAGNSITPSINPEALIQDITWTAVMRRYPDGVPKELRATEPLPGYAEAKRLYESCVTADGSAFKGVYPVRLPVNFATHNAYRGLPDSAAPGNYDGKRENWKRITKTGVNWGNDYPGYMLPTLPGLPVKYLEDQEQRSRLEREAFLRTLHFIYYVQHELGEPWSVADDEYEHAEPPIDGLPESWREIARRMPPIPYVRESRRAIGEYTLTSEELLRNSLNYRDGRSHEFEDAIATGRYNLDLHGAGNNANLEWELNEKSASIELNRPRGPFQVPLRILIPRDIDGLIIAEKNLSMTRIVSGALRTQPICMMVGQAAGALAALALQDGVPPRGVPPVRVQRALLEAGVVLSLTSCSDVPSKHPFYNSVQLSNLYGLIEPLVPPRASWPAKGIFGVDMPLTRNEMTVMLNKARLTARASAGREPGRSEKDRVSATRGMFLSAVIRAFGLLPLKGGEANNLEINSALNLLGLPDLYQPTLSPDHPITRGEAVEIVTRAMQQGQNSLIHQAGAD
jgi:hypothetical protein